jgi:hypothetical protein
LSSVFPENSFLPLLSQRLKITFTFGLSFFHHAALPEPVDTTSINGTCRLPDEKNPASNLICKVYFQSLPYYRARPYPNMPIWTGLRNSSFAIPLNNAPISGTGTRISSAGSTLRKPPPSI